MIVIDKNNATASIYFTLSEKVTYTNPVFIMTLQSDFTNKTYNIQLGTSSSDYPYRYDLFNLSTTLFNDIEDGLLSYSITENVYNPTQSNVVEVGLLKIIPVETTSDDYLYNTMEDTDDDYVVHRPQ